MDELEQIERYIATLHLQITTLKAQNQQLSDKIQSLLQNILKESLTDD